MTTAIYPPGPVATLPGRQLMAFRRDPLSFFTGLARNYGDVAHCRLGSHHMVLLNHPDYIKDVLVTHNRSFVKGRGLERAKRLLGEGLLTSEGEFHRRQRRLAQPAFHRQRIAGYGAAMVDYAARMAQRWQEGVALDISEEMMRLTLAIVGKTLFDSDVESEADEVRMTLTTMMEMFQLIAMPFSNLLERLPLPSVRRFDQARERLDAVIYRMIAERRKSGTDRGDLLSMLLLAHDAEGDPSTGAGRGEGMSDLQLRDEALTIFLAGHETTANALAWTWYLLSQYPAVEAQLHAELDTVLGERLPTVDDLPQLRYTEMVFAESMRLFPPAWLIGRRAIEEYRVAGYRLPANTIVIMSQWVMHHDPHYYPNPYRFDPLRWTPEAKAERPKFAYFPFGAGPRQCIGEQFAWMEGMLLLATLARRWRLRLVPSHPVALQPLITLRPRYGMRMTLQRR